MGGRASGVADDGLDLGISGLSGFTEIGQGGFAVVYSAFEDDIGRQVAVKVLRVVDAGGRRRFDRERRTMGQTTDHPNIVTLFRSGYTDPASEPFMVMEYLSKGSLQGRLDNDGVIGWDEAIELVLPVAGALGFAHSAGIVHKDVKPANILVSATGVVKLTDFGIAAIKEATATSQVAYSMAYTPPETFDVARDPVTGGPVDPRDERSDLYSLAATLYTLGTGALPFDSTTQAGLMNQILTQPVPRVETRPGLDEFFAVAMAKNPDHRYPTAAQFTQALATIGRPGHGPETVAARVVVAQPPQRLPVEPSYQRGTRLAVEPVKPQVPTRAGSSVSEVVKPLPQGPSPNRVTGRQGPRSTRGLVKALIGISLLAGTIWGIGQIRDPADPETTADPGFTIGTYTGHNSGVRSVVQLDGGLVASASTDETVQIWDPADP